MEYIERIFYRKINPSDFKKLYDIDRPEGGGGQTYLEAAGIPNEKIVDFLSYAEVSDSPLKEKGETRSVYTFNAYVLGNSKVGSAFIEFAPRSGRNNYRISRQNMKYKHPAWSVDNGFPEANKDTNGDYTSDGNFEGIIDNLVIWIIKTSNRKYYAGFVNKDTMPDAWPHDIGLEEIFRGERRGVIDTEPFRLQFIDNKECPFGDYSIMGIEEDRITSGFIMPYNMEQNYFELTSVVGNIGEAVGDWRHNKKFYERIQGIVMDTRYLMYHYTGNPMKEKVALADCIEAVLGKGEVPPVGGAPKHTPVSYMDMSPKQSVSMVAESLNYNIGQEKK